MEHDGYNISTTVTFFHNLPRLQLTNGGIKPLNNLTFDYGNRSYVNSLMFSFLIPLLILLFIFIIYIVYLFLLRFFDEIEHDDGQISSTITPIPLPIPTTTTNTISPSIEPIDPMTLCPIYDYPKNQFVPATTIPYPHPHPHPHSQFYYVTSCEPEIIHYTMENDDEMENKDKLKTLNKLKQQKYCHLIGIIFGLIIFLIICYGCLLMNNGFRTLDFKIEQFINESTNSKQNIRDWNDYFQKGRDKNLTKHHHHHLNRNNSKPSTYQRYLKHFNETIYHYTNMNSIERMWYVYKHYQWTTYITLVINLIISGFMLTYWIYLFVKAGWLIKINLCCCRKKKQSKEEYNEDSDGQIKRLILITITLVIICWWMFDCHLVTSMAMADFCYSSKDSLTDIVVYKYPQNNFSIPFVRYYLDCDFPRRWNLGNHKQSIFNYLDRVEQLELFNIPIGQYLKQNFNVVDRVKGNINQTYQMISCEHLNHIINDALTQLCTIPFDGLTIITGGHLCNSLLTMLMLFIITFLF